MGSNQLNILHMTTLNISVCVAVATCSRQGSHGCIVYTSTIPHGTNKEIDLMPKLLICSRAVSSPVILLSRGVRQCLMPHLSTYLTITARISPNLKVPSKVIKICLSLISALFFDQAQMESYQADKVLKKSA